MPVPDKAIVRFGFEAFDTTETLPPTLPAEVGVKAAPNVKLCPGIRVMGKLSPLTLYGAAVVAAVMVTLEPPELVKV